MRSSTRAAFDALPDRRPGTTRRGTGRAATNRADHRYRRLQHASAVGHAGLPVAARLRGRLRACRRHGARPSKSLCFFDIEAFFRLAAERGIELSWITGRDAEEIKKFSTRLRRAPDAWGVRARMPDGSRQDLLSGFFARLFGHYATPRQLIEMIERMPAQESRMFPGE